jgi:hypothetical protein
MQRAAQWMIFIPLTVLLLSMFAVEILNRLYAGHGRLLDVISVFLPLMIPGALLWLAGWIVEGFAKETH